MRKRLGLRRVIFGLNKILNSPDWVLGPKTEQIGKILASCVLKSAERRKRDIGWDTKVVENDEKKEKVFVQKENSLFDDKQLDLLDSVFDK